MSFFKLKKNFIIVFVIFILCAYHLSARGAQELVESGHWIYDSLTALSLETRILNFSGTAPLSIQQIKLILDEYDYDSLSESGRADYDRIIRYCDEEPLGLVFSDIVTLGVEPELNFEGFYKTNDDIDWVYDRYERNPVIDAPFSVSVADYVTLKMDVHLSQNKGAMQHNDNYTNILTSPDDFDINFPDYGYLSTGKMFTKKTGFRFDIGSGTTSVGRTLTGSMIWSDYLTGTSYARLEIFSPNFKYTGGITQFNVDKYFYHHQMDIRLFKKFQISFIEGLLVNSSMELRYLNPWTIFHGFAAWRDYGPDFGDDDYDDPENHTCDFFGINFQFTPIKNTRFYGLFAMTQFQTPYETSNWGDSPTPNGLGFQGGNETYIPFGRGRFHFAIEGSWADPYLYIKESPNWSMVRTYSENMGDKAIFYEWLGSPFGPDTISGELTVGYEIPDKWSLDFIYLFMARGEQSGTNVFDNINWGGQDTRFETAEDYKSWAYPDLSQADWEEKRDAVCPTGTPEFVNRLSLRGTYRFNQNIKFTFQPSYVVIINNNHERGENAYGFEIAGSLNISLFKNSTKKLKGLFED